MGTLLKNEKIKKFVWWLLFAFILGNLLFYLISNQQYFTREFDLAYLSETYSKSQYVVGAASEGGIGDDGLYAFAGYYYLFQRGDVSAVNFEHPPLGKYLIGLSILIFRNENVINIIYFFILLWITYKIGKLLFKDNLLSLVSIGILSVDRLFLDNLIRSLLDLPFTLFFTTAVYFFLLAKQNPRYYYLSMLFWGAAFSTRFFPALIIIYIFLFIVTYFYTRKNLTSFVLASFGVPAVYLISHISFFVYHPSFIEFLRHKKWMLSWFTGSVAIAGNIWRNIYTGLYLDSTKKIAINKEWTVILPFIVTFSLIPVKKYFVDKKNLGFRLLYMLSVLYLIYLTFLTDGVQKFLMPIYPLLCVLAVSNLAALYSIISAWKKRILQHLKVS